MKTTRIMCVLLWLLPMQAHARDLVIFAAASLKEPLDKIAAEFGGAVVTYAGSGTLARQVSLGAPADIVVLAHPRWMNVLADAGDIGARGVLARNQLVLVAPDAGEVALTVKDMTQALGARRMAIGFVNAVPAGIYGRAALSHLGLWDHVSGQLAEVDNVRAALALVARGEVPLGVVYATDARVSDAVHVVASFPTGSHPEIIYEYGVVTGATHPDAARFAAMLGADAAQAVLRDAGFLAP